MKNYGTVSDGVQSYKTVVIGTQTWMAQNLNYDVEGSRCYGDNTGSDSQGNCDTYGRLYNWADAMNIDASCNSKTIAECVATVNDKHQGVCPSGWHIPSNIEWRVLAIFVGGEETAGTKLKATSGWNDYNGSSGNGTDDYGFAALPGGYGYPDSAFNGVGASGYWWNATEYTEAYDGNTARNLGMFYDSELVVRNVNSKPYFYSVRCLQNSP